jgi:adenosylmethionine-8-amino-7-oxononanoate aminotransferase
MSLDAADNSRRAALMAADKQFVWHPFTPMKQYIEGEPIVVESGDGFLVRDTAGREYIDGTSSLWCNLHGHRVREIDDAIRAQLERIAHSTLLGLASIPSIELAERLVRIAPKGEPGLAKVFYSDSGASAVEVALKMAFQYYHNLGQPRRRRFLALREGYHGDTLGAVSVGGIDTFHKVFRPLLFETTFVDSPNAFYHPAGSAAGGIVLEQIDAALREAPGEYCGVVIEPLIQAAAGMLTHPAGFLRQLRGITRRRDVLLIADEVATGFCRTGTMFACEQENVCPDLMCLGKGLTGGYLPVAATLASRDIFDAFLGDPTVPGLAGRTFYHGHTFTGNALGCAAAVASVDRIESGGLLKDLPAKIELIDRKLSALKDHPRVGDIRQCGMMVGIDLVRDREKREYFEPVQRIGAAVCRHAQRHGILIRPLVDILVLMPAPGMDTQTLTRLLDATVSSIHEYFAEHPV